MLHKLPQWEKFETIFVYFHHIVTATVLRITHYFLGYSESLKMSKEFKMHEEAMLLHVYEIFQKMEKF